MRNVFLLYYTRSCVPCCSGVRNRDFAGVGGENAIFSNRRVAATVANRDVTLHENKVVTNHFLCFGWRANYATWRLTRDHNRNASDAVLQMKTRWNSYLPGTGGTMIMTAVLPGRGLSIAPRFGWPLRSPQMRVTRVRNFSVGGTAFALSPDHNSPMNDQYNEQD